LPPILRTHSPSLFLLRVGEVKAHSSLFERGILVSFETTLVEEGKHLVPLSPLGGM
jgi:hypothetical protein